MTDKEDHNERAIQVVRMCQEKGRRARIKNNVRCTSTRKETARKTENQVERLVYTRYMESAYRRSRRSRRTYWTGQRGRMIFINIPTTPDNRKRQKMLPYL